MTRSVRQATSAYRLKVRWYGVSEREEVAGGDATALIEEPPAVKLRWKLRSDHESDATPVFFLASDATTAVLRFIYSNHAEAYL